MIPSKRRRAALTIIAFGAGLSQAACVSSTQRYRLVDLGDLVCSGSNGCYVGDLNDWCEVAGWDVLSGGTSHAYVWRPGATTPTERQMVLPALEYDPNWEKKTTPQGPIWVTNTHGQAAHFRAYDINNYGDVVGDGSGPRNEAIVWALRPTVPGSAGTPHQTAYIGDLAGGSTVSLAYGINDEFLITGASSTQSGPHAFIFNYYSGMRDLGDLPNGALPDDAKGLAIGNDRVAGVGKATGVNATAVNHAFYWDLDMTSSALIDLGVLPGGNKSQANGVNFRGTVVGESTVPGGMHAFAWDKGTPMRDLGDLAGGANESSAYAIGDVYTNPATGGGPLAPGDIVGFGSVALIGNPDPSQGKRAVGWPAPTAGSTTYGAPIDLNTLIDPQIAAVTVTEARGINRFGIISAKGFDRRDARNHVYILVPANADVVGASGKSAYQQYCLGPAAGLP